MWNLRLSSSSFLLRIALKPKSATGNSYEEREERKVRNHSQRKRSQKFVLF